ncbi:MAG: FTR1 family protein [Aeropyrum sp.]|nr:FTR1 family protein [Aeropyrum sp.]
MSEFLASALVAFREAFEAVLLVSIIVMLLKKIGATDRIKFTYLSSAVSVLIGLALGGAIYYIFRGFPEQALVEAGLSYLAAAVITTVIVWGVRHGPTIKQEIESKLAQSLTPIGVTIVTFIFVFREVLETVLITAPYALTAPLSTLSGVGVGTVAALILGVLVYMVGLRVNLRTFFLGTSILLAFIASGLVGYGTHELFEWFEDRGVSLGPIENKIVFLDVGENSLMHPSNVIGGILSVMVGYYPYMEIGRIILQGGVLVALLAYILTAYGIIGSPRVHPQARSGKASPAGAVEKPVR